MATTHVVFSYYTVVYSECDHENNQSTYIFLTHEASYKTCYRVIFWLLMAENTVRGVRLFLRFNMYLFFAQFDQIYLF